MTEAKELPKHKIVYLGRRVGSNNKLISAFIPLDKLPMEWSEVDFQNGYLTHVSYFEPGKKLHLIVGGIYNWKCELAEDGRASRIVFDGMAYEDRINNNQIIKVCGIADETAYHAAKAANKLKRLSDEPVLERELERIKLIYKKLPYNDRTSFKVMLLDYLSKP